MNHLPESWRRTWAALGAQGSGELALQDLLSRWAEPQRHYHSLQHLRECIDGFGRVAHLAQRSAEVEAALWFHDAVYNLRESGNEDKSAQLAQRCLAAAAVAPDVVDRVVALVLVTKHTGRPATPDEALLVDIDLAILGAAPERFDEYDRQVVAGIQLRTALSVSAQTARNSCGVGGAAAALCHGALSCGARRASARESGAGHCGLWVVM